MTMKIELGKFYRTRDGQKVGPMALLKPDDVYRWNTIGHRGGRYRDDGEDGNATGGTFQAGGDLVAEWADTPDLTALTTPFGLLDRDTQEALKAHGGPYEHYYESRWRGAVDTPGAWIECHAYRVKPAPPKPREWWVVEWSDGDTQLYSSNGDAEDAARSLERNSWHNVKIIHVIEKLPE